MISTRNLKSAVFRSNKFIPPDKLTAILDSLKAHITILSDETGRTVNLTRHDGKLPAPLLPKPDSIHLGGSTQIGAQPDLKKATADKFLPFINAMKPIAAGCSATLRFARSYHGATRQPVVEIAVRFKGGHTSLELGFSSNHGASPIDAAAVRSVFAFFEKLLNAPGKFTACVQQTVSTDQPKAAFRETITFAEDNFTSLVAALLGNAGPAGLKSDSCQLHINNSGAWNPVIFNRGVELLNSHAPLFKEAFINYFWTLQRHEDYPLLAALYETIDDQDTDSCLYTFKLPGGVEGILLLTYGQKGYRLFVSFDDQTSIDEFEALTKIKFSLF